MDPIFDRFGRLVKSMFATEEDYDTSWDNDTVDSNTADSDFKDAWDELEDFLKSGDFSADPGTRSFDPSSKQAPEMPNHVRVEYDKLGLKYTADLAEIRKTYKKLILECHPDRVDQSPESQKAATRKAAGINESYKIIETWLSSQEL